MPGKVQRVSILFCDHNQMYKEYWIGTNSNKESEAETAYLGVMSQCSYFGKGGHPRLRISQKQNKIFPLIRYIVFLRTLKASE